jgi:hypothetical protein
MGSQQEQGLEFPAAEATWFLQNLSKVPVDEVLESLDIETTSRHEHYG